MAASYEMLIDDGDSGTVRYDLRDAGPTRVCICGSEFWRVLARFGEDGELSLYFLDVVCVECGAIARAVTPTEPADV